MPILEALELVKTFGDFAAVDRLSFSVEPGEVVAILGANGAGKTTTMRMLAGYFLPTSGTARIAGFDVTTQTVRSQSQLGYLPEVPPLYPEMTVRAYLEFVARLRGASGAVARQRAERALERCWLTERADWIIDQLSRGWRQRVGIAQAIVGEPTVLILDEPTAGLDPEQIMMVRKLIGELARDRTVLFSTHILAEAERVCSRAIIIRDGRILADESVASLLARRGPTEELRLSLRAPAEPAVTALGAVAGVGTVSVLNHAPDDSQVELRVVAVRRPALVHDLTRVALERGWTVLELEPSRQSLEDVYLKLVGATPPPA